MKCAYCDQWYCARCWKCDRPICENHAVDDGIDYDNGGNKVPLHKCAQECDGKDEKAYWDFYEYSDGYPDSIDNDDEEE